MKARMIVKVRTALLTTCCIMVLFISNCSNSDTADLSGDVYDLAPFTDSSFQVIYEGQTFDVIQSGRINIQNVLKVDSIDVTVPDLQDTFRVYSFFLSNEENLVFDRLQLGITRVNPDGVPFVESISIINEVLKALLSGGGTVFKKSDDRPPPITKSMGFHLPDGAASSPPVPD